MGIQQSSTDDDSGGWNRSISSVSMSHPNSATNSRYSFGFGHKVYVDPLIVSIMMPLYYTTDPITFNDLMIAKQAWDSVILPIDTMSTHLSYPADC